MVSSDGLALQDIHNARDVILDSYNLIGTNIYR
jgi:hypothetical protein